jgi:lipoprotein NlpI
MLRPVIWMGLSLCCSTLLAAEPPLPAERLAKLEAGWQQAIRKATAALEADPQSLNAFSQRGDAYFFSGKFPSAVEDYTAMVKLDPQVDASHWRRGIAYFYAGQYAEAAGQFERYHSFDDVDRENGIWRYLSQVKAVGRAKAREGLLKYAKDDREPFPAVYELFAGRITGDEILAGIRAAKITDEEREKRLFYAELYIGLNDAVESRAESAQMHLAAAVKNTWAPTAGYGPHYMWEVARLHEGLLRTTAKEPKP